VSDIAFLTNLFYPAWTPPTEVGKRVHRIMQCTEPREKNQPVQARTKIMSALDKFQWKSIDQLAKETGLVTSTVAITTDRMYKARRIERKQTASTYGKVNLFRKK
jgi:hypothetical protein